MKLTGIILFFFICLNTIVSAQTKVYQTHRVTQKSPVIVGRYDEAAWHVVEWSGDFIQRVPDSGTNPSQNTDFKILFDDNNLYIVIRALDSVPGEIVSRLSRRDQDDGDWLAVSIDS